MKTIESVKIVRELDIDPDLSHLGEYSNRPTSPDAIDRLERGHMERGTYRFFNPAMTGEETGNPDSPEQDYQRMEAYNRNVWCMLGVYAVAEIVVNGVCQSIRSPGLWGIESDSEESYFEEVGGDELLNLRDQLLELGFSTDEVSEALGDVEQERV